MPRILSPNQKAAIETLLGRSVQEGEAASVRTFEPVTVSHPRKREIADELRKYFAEVDASRKRVSEEEAEDIVTEAMRSVRPAIAPFSENRSRSALRSRPGRRKRLPHLLIDVVESDRFLPISNEMLYELARVLRYPRMPPLHGLSENRIYDYVRFLRETAEIVVLNPLLITPIRDVNDTVAMQTAVIGEANILCTRDRDRHGTKAGDLHTTPALGAAAFGPDGQADRLSNFLSLRRALPAPSFHIPPRLPSHRGPGCWRNACGGLYRGAPDGCPPN